MTELEPPLYPFQSQAIQHLASPSTEPRHLLCIAPTGSGKSRIYEELARKRHQRVVLLTPLVALARQQRDRLKSRGIEESVVRIFSPEHLQNARIWESLRCWRPTLAVVDEAHCIAEWGRDFRPAFREILRLTQDLQLQRSLWLTATPSPELRNTLREGLAPHYQEQGAFAIPPQLQLNCLRLPISQRPHFVRSWIMTQRTPGIVFVPTRAWTSRLAQFLLASGIRAAPYHAGLAREERMNLEKQVREGQWEALIATSAFGMGMDTPILRWSIVLGPPGEVTALAQAVGRAGRDRTQTSQAWVLWEPEDFRLLEFLTSGRATAQARLREVRELFESKMSLTEGLCNYFSVPSPLQ